MRLYQCYRLSDVVFMNDPASQFELLMESRVVELLFANVAGKPPLNCSEAKRSHEFTVTVLDEFD